jgi:hypothetical protein
MSFRLGGKYKKLFHEWGDQLIGDYYIRVMEHVILPFLVHFLPFGIGLQPLIFIGRVGDAKGGRCLVGAIRPLQAFAAILFFLLL